MMAQPSLSQMRTPASLSMRPGRLSALRVALVLLGSFLLVEAVQVAPWSRDLAMGLLMGFVAMGLVFFYSLAVAPRE